MFFEHREESDSLFGLTVRVDDGFFHEVVEPALAQDGMRGSLPRSCRLPAWHSRHHPCRTVTRRPGDGRCPSKSMVRREP